MRNEKEIWNIVDALHEPFVVMSDTIWGMPELNFEEYRSSEEHARRLEAEGFTLHRGIAGIPTALMGEAGSGGPVIAFLGEYDALPGLSQEAGSVEKKTCAETGDNGHGCGHNLLGTGALLAAAAVKKYLEQHNLPGRVRYYGCPAEENGCGKTFMVRAGVFDDVDVALSWHPAPFAAVDAMSSLANQFIDFSFSGRASHAATSPHLGRSALDAIELMNVGVNYMREHMPQAARIHYAMLDGGGVAPNVVQAFAKVRYLIRAPDLQMLKELVARVRKIADGAALMSETQVSASVISGQSNLVDNMPLAKILQANFDRLGPPDFDEADREFARQIGRTFTKEDVATTYHRYGMTPLDPAPPLCDSIVPFECRNFVSGTASTDLGDVSWVVPTIYARGAVFAVGTPGHSWQLVSQGKLPAAHKGMMHVSKALAGTAIDVFENPARLEAIRADHRARVGDGYECPIPADTPVPLPA